MKRIFAITMTVILLLSLTMICGATETISDSVETEITTDIESTIVQEYIVEIIEDVENGNISIDEAINKLEKTSGMTREQAKEFIDKALQFGDKYFGDTAWWGNTSSNVQKNETVIVFVILLTLTIISLLINAVIQYFANKKINRIEYGTGKVVGDSEKTNKAISQTVGFLSENITEVLNDFKIVKQWLEEKENKIAELEAHNSELESGLLDAETYILQMLKLIYSRTNLTLTDKSLLDLWQAKAEARLKSKMTPEAQARHEEMVQMLNGSGDDDA